MLQRNGPMPLSKPVRWIIYGAVGLTALTRILLAVLALVKIPIDLKSQKALVEEITSSTIGRSAGDGDLKQSRPIGRSVFGRRLSEV